MPLGARLTPPRGGPRGVLQAVVRPLLLAVQQLVEYEATLVHEHKYDWDIHNPLYQENSLRVEETLADHFVTDGSVVVYTTQSVAEAPAQEEPSAPLKNSESTEMSFFACVAAAAQLTGVAT